ncbi:uncharacterized protein PHA67_007732 isoform 1-T2 [Liasis olivaceus]
MGVVAQRGGYAQAGSAETPRGQSAQLCPWAPPPAQGAGPRRSAGHGWEADPVRPPTPSPREPRKCPPVLQQPVTAPAQPAGHKAHSLCVERCAAVNTGLLNLLSSGQVDFISHSARGQPGNYGSAIDQVGPRMRKGSLLLLVEALRREESFEARRNSKRLFSPRLLQRCERLVPSFSRWTQFPGRRSEKDIASPKVVPWPPFYKRSIAQLGYQLSTIKANNSQ